MAFPQALVQSRLAAFPLHSIRTTYSVGFRGDHIVSIRFHRTHYRDDLLTRSEIVISVNSDHELQVGEPHHRVLDETPRAQRVSLADALEIAQEAVHDDDRFQGRRLRSVQIARSWSGAREGEPCWRIDWMAGPGPAYFVEVFMDGEIRVVVAGR